MAMYFLARGEDVSGPYGEGKLLQLADEGEIPIEAQLAIQGSEDWFPADDLLSSLRADRKNQEAMDRRSKRVPTSLIKRKRPYLPVSVLVAFLGLGLMIFVAPFWVGLLILIAGACLDRVRHICGKCGNRVEKTSTLCGACQCRLSRK